MARKNKTPLRNSTVTCVIGDSNKTDMLSHWVSMWLKFHNRGDIFIYDPQHRILKEQQDKYKKGQGHHLIVHNPEFTWINMIYDIYNTVKDKRKTPKLLVLNAGDILFPAPLEKIIIREKGIKKEIQQRPIMPMLFLELIMKKRLYNMDIIIAFQDPDSLPANLEYFTNRFIVLPVTMQYYVDRRNMVMSQLDLCIKATNKYDPFRKSFKEYIHFNTEKNIIYASPAMNRTEFEKIIKELTPERKKIDLNY